MCPNSPARCSGRSSLYPKLVPLESHSRTAAQLAATAFSTATSMFDPKTGAPERLHLPRPAIDPNPAGGTRYWNGEPVASRADMEARMATAAAQAVQPEVHIRPNKSASYNSFAEVMVSASRAGLVKLGVLGAEQFVESR